LLQFWAPSCTVLAKGLVILVLGNLTGEIKQLFDKVLANDLQNLILLEGLTRHVKEKILRFDDTLDEVKVLWNEVLTFVMKTRQT